MEYNKIEEARNYLMEKYGVPAETKMGSFTYKTVNYDLECFNKLINELLNCMELTKIEDCQNAVDVICDFAKDLDPYNMNILSTKLEKISTDIKRNVNFSRKPFIKLIAELNEDSAKKDFDKQRVMNYFVAHLGVKPVSYEIKTSKRRVDNQGDSYWRRNKGLEDNNF